MFKIRIRQTVIAYDFLRSLSGTTFFKIGLEVEEVKIKNKRGSKNPLPFKHYLASTPNSPMNRITNKIM